MGQILGLGITHYPNLAASVNMAWRMQKSLDDPALPAALRLQENWHPTMRAQWGNDRGQAHSDKHRQDLIDQFRRIRAELDAFNPDFVLIWGDDQYENFREDCVPAFSILAYDSVDFQPWKNYRRGRNVWDEPDDKTVTVNGHRAAGKYLATALLTEGIDVAYAYKPLHHPLGHAFANSVLFLDYDRKGFSWPVVPFAVNAYGRWLIAGGGVQMTPSSDGQMPGNENELDPPAPQPWRCFDVGAAIGRALEASPWRVAVIAMGWLLRVSAFAAVWSLEGRDTPDCQRRMHAPARPGQSIMARKPASQAKRQHCRPGYTRDGNPSGRIQ